MTDSALFCALWWQQADELYFKSIGKDGVRAPHSCVVTSNTVHVRARLCLIRCIAGVLPPAVSLRRSRPSSASLALLFLIISLVLALPACLPACLLAFRVLFQDDVDISNDDDLDEAAQRLRKGRQVGEHHHQLLFFISFLRRRLSLVRGSTLHYAKLARGGLVVFTKGRGRNLFLVCMLCVVRCVLCVVCVFVLAFVSYCWLCLCLCDV